ATHWKGKCIDLSKAYKELAVYPQHRPLAVIAVRGADGRDALYLSNSLMFGSTAAVYAFNRISRCIWFLINRLLWIPAGVFHDDFPLLSPAESSDNADAVVSAFLDELGWLHAKTGAKGKPFAEEFDVLGMSLQLSSFGQGKVVLANKQGRIERIIERMQEIAAKGEIRRHEAQVLQGLLQYASGFYSGRALKHASHVLAKISSGLHFGPKDLSDFCLHTVSLLRDESPRILSSSMITDVVHLWTDGAWESGIAGVGVAVHDCFAGTGWVYEGRVPAKVLDKWKTEVGEQLICEIEMFAVLATMLELNTFLSTRRVIWWIDNDATRAVIIKGASRSWAMHELARLFSELDTQYPSMWWVCRVPSFSNPGDAPSRGHGSEAMTAVGASKVQKFSMLDELSERLCAFKRASVIRGHTSVLRVLRAAFHGVGDLTAAERKNTVRCTGWPFYEENRRAAVSLEQIGEFEMANLGLVEIVVYGWVEKTWRGTRRVGETQLRLPLQEVIEVRNPVVVLLLHEGHYSLVYNFDAFVSQRSSQISVRWHKGDHVNCCPICRANFKSELALKAHFRTGACRYDFEGRRSQNALPSPENALLKYVFSDAAPEHAAVKGVQNRAAAAAYVAVGSCGYEPPEEHRLWMDRAREGEPEDSVVVRFLKSAQDLAGHYINWSRGWKSIRWTPELLRQHEQTERCNHAAHTPSELTICLRNGGNHFILRGPPRYLLFVDYDFPEELHDKIDWPPPARLSVRSGDVGPYTKGAVKNRPPCEKLVPFLGMHVAEGIHSTRLAFLRNHLGARIWRLRRAWSFMKHRTLQRFMESAYERRRELKEAGRSLEQSFEKLSINSIYGKTIQNQEKYRNTSLYFDAARLSRAQAGRSVADFNVEVMERDAFMGSVSRVRTCGVRQALQSEPSPSGLGRPGALKASKLKIAWQYWMGVKAVLPRVVPILTDTDSMLLEIIGDCDPRKLLAEANLTLPVEFDLL
ncbi:unnamed protein product, partial [Symbiodinium necroappetens]